MADVLRRLMLSGFRPIPRINDPKYNSELARGFIRMKQRQPDQLFSEKASAMIDQGQEYDNRRRRCRWRGSRRERQRGRTGWDAGPSWCGGPGWSTGGSPGWSASRCTCWRAGRGIGRDARWRMSWRAGRSPGRRMSRRTGWGMCRSRGCRRIGRSQSGSARRCWGRRKQRSMLRFLRVDLIAMGIPGKYFGKSILAHDA